MTGELNPRCVICGDELDLTEHLERLNQHQSLIFFLADVVPGSNPRMFDTTCQACKSDPDRAEAHLSAMAPGEARRRMVEEVRRRTGHETPGMRELKAQSYIDPVEVARYAIPAPYAGEGDDLLNTLDGERQEIAHALGCIKHGGGPTRRARTV